MTASSAIAFEDDRCAQSLAPVMLTVGAGDLRPIDESGRVALRVHGRLAARLPNQAKASQRAARSAWRNAAHDDPDPA